MISLWGLPRIAHAAESYDNCTGFITSLPVSITTQGTWCLKQDLATALTGGGVITINTNNVTIDCNNFKLGGLAAGLSTQAFGIYAQDRVNITVRHCNIRGFYNGLLLTGASGGGHLAENNRFDGNTFQAIDVEGDGSVVRSNLVSDTGGSTAFPGASAIGIASQYSVDILDNSVFGVSATSGGNGSAVGINTALADGASISGNRVRGLVDVSPRSRIACNGKKTRLRPGFLFVAASPIRRMLQDSAWTREIKWQGSIRVRAHS